MLLPLMWNSSAKFEDVHILPFSLNHNGAHFVLDRPLAHIFCIVTTLTSEFESAHVHREDISLQLEDIVKVALMEIMRIDSKIHYTRVQVCIVTSS